MGCWGCLLVFPEIVLWPLYAIWKVVEAIAEEIAWQRKKSRR